MFPFVERIKKKNGAVYEYLVIKESYRDEDKPRTRDVARLGRLDQLKDALPELVKALSRFCDERLVAPGDVTSADALPWGHVLLARHLFDRLNLGEIIASCCGSARQEFDVAETAFALIANRLTDPGSEHRLARWLENTYVCDREGRRWLPHWLPEEEITKRQRVRVDWTQLQLWYRTLDALLAGRERIETCLYERVRDLFSLEVDMVFYDVTNTYFARRKPKGRLRRHGKCKQGRRRNVLVALGVVLANGWPIAHHIFPGNTTDTKTFQSVVSDIENRFGLRRVLVVGDRGMVSSENLRFLSAEGREVRYLLAIPGRQSEEAQAVLAQLDEKRWTRVDDANRVQQVSLDGSAVRYFVVDSDERRDYEADLRAKSMARAQEELESVRKAVDAGRLTDPKKIAARAAVAMSRNHAKRYYSDEVGADGTYRFWADEEKLARETLREGRYILKSDDAQITAHESVGIYKQLSDVEWAYRDLKDVIELRPVYHKSDRRVEAHIFVATLALFLKRTLEHLLREQRVDLSPTEAFAAMRSIGASVLDFGDRRAVLASGGGRDARRLVKALGLGDLTPPQPPEDAQQGRN